MDVHIVRSDALSARDRDEVLALCRAAYAEDLEEYYAALGPGLHLLGRLDGRLVAQLIVVYRALQPDGHPPLRTGYVELVATHPTVQGRGYASTLLRAVPALLQDCDLGGLSPSDAGFYARLGWELWTGPLAVRSANGIEATPGEALMVLRLPQSPPWLDLSSGVSIEWRPGEIW